MKNIHRINGEIYITDPKEKILNGDWVCNGEVLFKRFSTINLNILCQKVIMSSDKQLGVQKIDSSVLSFLAGNLQVETLDVKHQLINSTGREVNPNNINQNHSECKWKYKVFLPYTEYLKTKSAKQVEKLYTKTELLEHLNLLYSMKNSMVDTFIDENNYITDKWFTQFT